MADTAASLEAERQAALASIVEAARFAREDPSKSDASKEIWAKREKERYATLEAVNTRINALTTAEAAPAAPDPAATPERQDALAIIRNMLIEFDLESEVDWAWESMVQGKGQTQVLFELRQRPVYKQRYAIMEERRKAGMAPITEAEWRRTEEGYKQVARRWNLPTGFYDSPDDFIQWGVYDIAPAELNDRIQEHHDFTAPQREQARATFTEWYGVAPDDGSLLAYAIDAKRALPLVQRQLRSAAIGGSARDMGLGIDQGRAESLLARGVTSDLARQGFSRVAGELETQKFQAGATTEALSQEELEDEVFAGDARGTRRRQLRAREAAGQFETGGGAAATGRGVIGAGSIRR